MLPLVKVVLVLLLELVTDNQLVISLLSALHLEKIVSLTVLLPKVEVLEAVLTTDTHQNQLVEQEVVAEVPLDIVMADLEVEVLEHLVKEKVAAEVVLSIILVVAVESINLELTLLVHQMVGMVF